VDSITVSREEGISSQGPRLAIRRRSADDVAWLGLVPTTLLLLALVLWLAPTLSHLYPGSSEQVFPQWRFLVKPEPLEATRFIIAALGPLILSAVVLALGTGHPGRRSLDGAVIGIQLLGAGFLAWSVAHQIHVPPHTRPDYFDPLLLSVPNVIAGAVIGVVLAALCTSRVEVHQPRVRAITSWLSGTRGIAFAVAVAFTAIWLLPGVFTDATVGQAGQISTSHIPVQAEDYFAVVNGRTPLVDYIPVYVHLLPLALEPVLATFDSSLTALSIGMCLLSLVTLLSVYGTFSEVTRGRWAALGLYLPFVAISLFPWDRQGAAWDYDGNYYGFFPGRYLGPFVVAWLCALRLRGRRLPVWFIFFAAGLGVANNTEFGVPALAAAVVALALGPEPSTPVRRWASRVAAHAIGGVVAALLLVCVVTLVRSGELPNPSYATYWSSTFAREGYGLEPMPLLGLHWAVYLTYAGALLTAAVRYVRKAANQTLTGMLGFAGLFGILSGFYFAGRSLPWQLMLLFPVWGFALALLSWTIMQALRAGRGDPLRQRRLILPALAALAGFGVMVAAIDRFPLPWQQVDRLSAGGKAVNDQPAIQKFVDGHTSPGEHVLILGPALDHRIADRAGVVNTSPYYGLLALLSEQDVNRAVDSLEGEGGRKVFESGNLVKGITSRPFPELPEILRQRGFEHRRRDPASGLVQWDLR
jgi:hypothetical protein